MKHAVSDRGARKGPSKTVVAFDRDMNEVREQAVLIWGERAFRQKEQQVQRP